MNKKQIAAIVIPFVLVFGFQNCQKNPGAFKDDGSVSVDKTELMSLQHESLSTIEFNTNLTRQRQKTGSSSAMTISGDVILEINLESGVMRYKSKNEGINLDTKKYCLEEASKLKLNEYLRKDSLCQINKLPDGSITTAEVKMGYANLTSTNKEDILLGGGYSAFLQQDLCNNSEAIQQMYKDILIRLPTLVCD